MVERHLELAQVLARLHQYQRAAAVAVAVVAALVPALIRTFSMLAATLLGADAKALRETMDKLIDKLKSAAIVLAAPTLPRCRRRFIRAEPSSLLPAAAWRPR